jgi:hypothetical protein
MSPHYHKKLMFSCLLEFGLNELTFYLETDLHPFLKSDPDPHIFSKLDPEPGTHTFSKLDPA